VVEVALHGNQFPVTDRGDHATAARAEVAGGSELADVGELQLLGVRSHSRHIDKATQRNPGTTTRRRPEPLSPSNRCQGPG
jgi:hypothetical protein